MDIKPARASDNDAGPLKIFPAAVPFNLPPTTSFEEDLKIYLKAKRLFLLSLTHDDKAVIQSGLPNEINELTESFVVGKKSEITLLDVLRLKKKSQSSSSFKYDTCQTRESDARKNEPQIVTGQPEKLNNDQKLEKKKSVSAIDALEAPGDLNSESVDGVDSQTCVIGSNTKTESKSSDLGTSTIVTTKSNINRKEFRWERMSLWKTRFLKATPSENDGDNERENVDSFWKNVGSNRVVPVATPASLSTQFAFYSKSKTKNAAINPPPVPSSLNKCSGQLNVNKPDINANDKPATIVAKSSHGSNESSKAKAAVEINDTKSSKDKSKTSTKTKKKKKGRSSSSSSDDLESLEQRSEARLGRK